MDVSAKTVSFLALYMIWITLIVIHFHFEYISWELINRMTLLCSMKLWRRRDWAKYAQEAHLGYLIGQMLAPPVSKQDRQVRQARQDFPRRTSTLILTMHIYIETSSTSPARIMTVIAAKRRGIWAAVAIASCGKPFRKSSRPFEILSSNLLCLL